MDDGDARLDLFHDAPVIAVTIDRTGAVVNGNRRLADVSGHAIDAMAGSPATEFLPADLAWAVLELLQLVFDSTESFGIGGPTPLSILTDDEGELAVSAYATYPTDPRTNDPLVHAALSPMSVTPLAFQGLALALSGAALPDLANIACFTLASRPIDGHSIVWSTESGSLEALAHHGVEPDLIDSISGVSGSLVPLPGEFAVHEVEPGSNLAQAGYRSIWHVAVKNRDLAATVLRSVPGTPTPDQLRRTRHVMGMFEVAAATAP